MKSIAYQYFRTPFGELILGSYQKQLCLADWRYRKMRTAVDDRLRKTLNADFVEADRPVLEDARRQLQEYWEGSRSSFDLPLLMAGTDFQKNVWEELLEIPYGKTSTYLELSRKLGNEKAIRAVAAANGANAISIIIPCHRIIGIDGELVGYAGGLQVKKRLLQLEKAPVADQLSIF